MKEFLSHTGTASTLCVHGSPPTVRRLSGHCGAPVLSLSCVWLLTLLLLLLLTWMLFCFISCISSDSSAAICTETNTWDSVGYRLLFTFWLSTLFPSHDLNYTALWSPFTVGCAWNTLPSHYGLKVESLESLSTLSLALFSRLQVLCSIVDRCWAWIKKYQFNKQYIRTLNRICSRRDRRNCSDDASLK